MNRNGLGLVLGIAVLLCAAGPAQAVTFVNPADGCDQELNLPGEEYVLTGDLSCATPSNGVRITASGVVFRLGGHTISGEFCDWSQNLSGIVVSPGVENVEVEGGTTSGFNDGILLYGVRSRVRGMTVTGACAFGVVVSGTYNRVDTTVVTASGIDGVVLAAAHVATVVSNDIFGNTRVGVDITEFSNDNVIEHNIVRGNGVTEGYGIAIFNGEANTIRNNAVNGNFNGIGIMSENNTAEDNTVNRSVHSGISISDTGAGSVVQRNTALGSGRLDMSDQAAGCGANTWTGNAFDTDEAGGVPDGGRWAGCIR